MENQITIQESDLELVVSEKTLGSLTTNAIQIRDMVKAALPMYDISNYSDDNIDQAKRDKATLNKAAKALISKRLEIEREFMKPFGEFKEVVNDTVKLIGECSAKIDTVVKQNEQQYKDRKNSSIRNYFDENNVNLVEFGKVFKPEWLNKSVSMKSVCSDIDSIFAQVENDLSSLSSFGEDFDVLRTYYMDTLNIASTIQYANRLKEQRERGVSHALRISFPGKYKTEPFFGHFPLPPFPDVRRVSLATSAFSAAFSLRNASVPFPTPPVRPILLPVFFSTAPKPSARMVFFTPRNMRMGHVTTRPILNETEPSMDLIAPLRCAIPLRSPAASSSL